MPQFGSALPRFVRSISFTICSLACVIAIVSPARASMILTVQETGGPAIAIFDNGPFDTDTSDPGVINVNTAALNSLLVNFKFSSLGSSSNRPLGGGAQTPAYITQTGEVSRSTLGGAFSMTINAADTDYPFPSANPKGMSTSASDTFMFTTAGDVRTFQSSFDPTNSTPPALGIPSPLLAFVPPVGIGPFSTSNPGVTTLLGAQPIPFGLNNTTVITLGPSAGSAVLQHDQFTGATVVTAVPEPATVALLALGSLLLARRRTT